MYPSTKYPHYGVFVKNCVKILEENDYDIKVIALQKENNRYIKIIKYLHFYLMTVFWGILGRFDYIYGHYASHIAVPLLVINKFRNIPMIINVHGNDVVAETKSDYKYQNVVYKLLNKSNIIVVPSKYFRDVLIKKYNLIPRKILIYPSGGVDTKLFNKMDRKKALLHLGLKDGYTYIGYVSRIEQNKGWDIFLAACKKQIELNSNIRIILVGDGNQNCEYEKLVDSLKIRQYIHKYNLLAQEDIAYVYNILDVFVFPTYRKSESLGLVGLEAMSCYTKTVLPDKYGPSSYSIDMQNSFSFKSGDADDLTRVIKKALDYNLNDIPINARDTAVEYDKENTSKILLEIFENLK